MNKIEFRITGQVRGGKNNMLVTRSGQHYPNPLFSAWKLKAMAQLRAQIRPGFAMVDSPDWNWDFHYVPEDKRRRDVTAILDSVFHVFEKVGIVKDDSLIKHLRFDENRPDKIMPYILITAERMDNDSQSA